MFISTDQTERDSATAYRMSALQHHWTGLHMPSFPPLIFHLCDPTGMTIEVLGTVLGTAIQGQIVGGTSDCPADLDAAEGRNVSRFTVSTVSLDESVRIAAFFHLSLQRMWLTGCVCPQKRAYMISSGVICIIYLLCTLVLFLGVKERKGMKV